MKIATAGLTVLITLATAGLAAAQAAPPPPPPAPAAATSVEIGGLVDVYYDYYSTKTAADAPYRLFDTRHNQFALSMAEVWLAKAPSTDSRVGFKLKLSFGPATSNFIHASEPGGSPYQNIQEAYVSYLAPAGQGLQIDAGVFVTPIGAEVIEAKDNYNYSRGFLFALAEPGYHSGIRLTYSPTSKVTLLGGIVNGWNNIVDNNTGKSLFGGITLKPTSALTVVENVISGPEQSGENGHWRTLSDTFLTYTASPKASVIAMYDYGRESFGDATSHWQGLAAYLRYQATSVVAVSPRIEFYDDASGVTTGRVQKLKEFTGTIEMKAADNLLWRIELRHDWSDTKPYINGDGDPQSSQTSIGFGLLYSFSGKVE